MKTHYLSKHLKKIAMVIALSTIVTSSAFAITIIPEFTAGVLVCNSQGTSCKPVMCSTDPNHPTPTPTGPNVFAPINYIFAPYGIPPIFTTSCMTPQEMAAVNQAIKNIEAVTTDNITVHVEYYDSPNLATAIPGFPILGVNAPIFYLVQSNDPVHNPGAAYTAVLERLQEKSALDLLNGARLGSPNSVNTTFLLPTYNQLAVEYSQVNNYFILSNFFDNTPQTADLYAQTYTPGSDNFSPTVTKPNVMMLSSAQIANLTDNGAYPLPGVTLSFLPGGYSNTLTNVTGAVTNATVIPEYYSETDPSIIAQQPEFPSIVAGNYLTLGGEALENGNLTFAGIFPTDYNPSFDLTQVMTHETIEELGKDSAVTYLAGGDILPSEQTVMSIMDMYMVDKATVSSINFASYAKTPRLQQYEGNLLANGNQAGHHVLLYHVGVLPGDSNKYLGEQEAFGSDYDDFVCPVPTPDYIHFATFQQPGDAPALYDKYGNALNSAQSECGLQGQIQPLSVRELIELNAMGYGVQDVNNFSNAYTCSAPNSDGSCNVRKLTPVSLHTGL